MPQNHESGVEAREFGLRTAALIGEKIGARKIHSNGNEFDWNGQHVTIRTAHQKTNQVGVLLSMLDRVHTVIAAFESITNNYELYSLSPVEYRQRMRVPKSNAGRVGVVVKRIFVERGSFVAKVAL
jgi:hypothetical protein